MTLIETERLYLRAWREEDVEPFYQINQDSKMLEFLPHSLSRDELRKFISKKNRCLLEYGYTFWAVEEKKSGMLLGFVGLDNVGEPFHFAPAVEIAWRLGSQYWGQGYATEAAKAVLKYGFQLSLKEIVAHTVTTNYRSQRVMEKIGMIRDPSGDFSHPKVPKDHRLSKHVLYRIKNSH